MLHSERGVLTALKTGKERFKYQLVQWEKAHYFPLYSLFHALNKGVTLPALNRKTVSNGKRNKSPQAVKVPVKY